MTSRQYDAIDEKAAAEIKRLHKEHPKLGHGGLIKALRQANIEVDPNELKLFMRLNNIKPVHEWRPWRWHGAPAWLVRFAGAVNDSTDDVGRKQL